MNIFDRPHIPLDCKKADNAEIEWDFNPCQMLVCVSV
uniref:Uncharacterized protein n=1 Tax=Setaria italica TaxID=4555 RepID=K4APJ8_SETIT